jgi:deoxyadenosine/deoxycytidine kinase
MFKKIKNKHIFMIEGPTGGGKTTLAHILQDALSADLVKEPFDKWQHVNQTENLFETFRGEPQRWAYTFQSYAFITEIEAFNQTIKKGKAKIVLSDRSMYSGLCCFTKMFYDQGLLTPLEWHLYKNITNWLLAYFSFIPQGFIYVRTPPELCYERNIKRNRPTDHPLHLDFFTRELAYHDEWLIDKKLMPKLLLDVPILVLDGAQDFLNDKKIRDAVIQQVRDFIAKI